MPVRSKRIDDNVLCNSNVEARLSRVDESEEREGFEEDSVEREGRRSSRARLQAEASWLLWLNPQDCHLSGTDFSL